MIIFNCATLWRVLKLCFENCLVFFLFNYHLEYIKKIVTVYAGRQAPAENDVVQCTLGEIMDSTTQPGSLAAICGSFVWMLFCRIQIIK
jgi:hypothetical protein